MLAGVLGEVYIVDRLDPHVNPFEPRFSVPLIIGLIVAAYFIFQERSPWVKRNGVLTYRRKDELVPDIYRARRAIELKNPDTSDRWYLIELDSGKVLGLCDNLPTGPIGYDSSNPDVRRFPCTEFTILRHPPENITAGIDCSGTLIRPITVLVADHYSDWVYTQLPNDGEIIKDRTFDDLLAELQELSRKESAGLIFPGD
jgi:hypothetical protein